MQIFPFIVPSTEKSKVTNTITATISLHDEYFLMTEEYNTDYKDEDEDWSPANPEIRRSTSFHLKSKVTGYKKYWYCKTKVWGVEINMMGAIDNVQPYFKFESKAQEFCEALQQWLLNKEPHENKLG